VILTLTFNFIIRGGQARSPRNHRVSLALRPSRSQTFRYTVRHYGQDMLGEELP
jgi:hypothetical protein